MDFQNFKLSKRTKRNLLKGNKVVSDKLMPAAVVDFELSSESRVEFEADVECNSVMGSYQYDKRGRVHHYSTTIFDCDNQLALSYWFDIKKGAKYFKRHAKTMAKLDQSDIYNDILTRGLDSANGGEMAAFLDQLPGAAPGDKSTAVSFVGGEIFFA